jgi:hypothetical protein
MEDLLLVRLLGGRFSHSDSINRFGLDSFASTRLYFYLRSVNSYIICHFVGYYLYPYLPMDGEPKAIPLLFLDFHYRCIKESSLGISLLDRTTFLRISGRCS